MKRRYALVAIILVVFGLVRIPVEHSLAEQHQKAFFHGAKLDLSLWDKIGLHGFLAALSGFRSVVADLLYIQAHVAWERTEWGRMALLFDSVVSLQPRSVLFWDTAAWHMAWNASVAARQDARQPREALRIKAQREYFNLGKDFLERGIRNNPDRYVLYERLALLYKEKLADHCSAAEAFLKAGDFDDAPAYEKRFAAYELAACPGKERAAYELLRELYLEGPHERVPTLLRLLGELQEKLNVAPDQRAYTPPRP